VRQPSQADLELRTQAAVGALWERFRSTTLERVSALEAACHALTAGTLDALARREAERAAHKLAGALGSFGRPEGSWLARTIEHALAGETELDAATIGRLVEQ